MEIINCVPSDLDEILSLYEAARLLQTEKKMVVWPVFEPSLVMGEIQEKRQWKIVAGNTMACNWAITFEDKEIWEHRDRGDAIYIHRICTHPASRGHRFIDQIVNWAKEYARQSEKQFVRLDTLGNNTGLIRHYTSAGFEFLGIFRITDTSNLPGHYQKEPDCCLFQIDLGPAID
jgi:ribosomal protein S18 acetylase RimI-like enzyme